MNSFPAPRTRRRLLAALVGLALVALVLWLTGAGQLLFPEHATVTRVGDTQPGLDVKPGVDLYPLDQRSSAPPLQGSTLDGDPFALSDLQGKLVVINVWGSWCAPCRLETPDLVQVANKTAGRGVRFVGIDTRDNPAAAQAFVRTFDVPYPSLNDPNGKLLLGFKDVVPTSVVPSTLVIDRQGRIAARIIGPVNATTLTGILDDELAAETNR